MSNITCLAHSTSAMTTINNVIYAGAYLVKPSCILLDLIGHTLCFIAFYRKWKAHNGNVYAFQVYENAAKTIDTLAALVYLITIQFFSKSDIINIPWFQTNYYLMMFTAHIPIPLTDTTTTVVLFVSLAMSVDRVYAVARPAKYKLINRRMWEIGSIISSIVISICICAFSTFVRTLVKDGNIYKLVPDNVFANTDYPLIFASIRSVIWSGLLIGIVASGAALISLHRSRLRKIGPTSSVGAHTNETEQTKQKKLADKRIFYLVIYDSMQALNEIVIMMAHTYLSYEPAIANCIEGKLILAIRNIEVSLVNASDFYVMLIVSKPFRNLIKDGLKR